MLYQYSYKFWCFLQIKICVSHVESLGYILSVCSTFKETVKLTAFHIFANIRVSVSPHPLQSLVLSIFFFFSWPYPRHEEVPRQRLNPCHNNDNIGSLTCWAIRELLSFFLILAIFCNSISLCFFKQLYWVIIYILCRVHPFRVYISVAFSIFRIVQPLPQSILEHFHHPSKETCTLPMHLHLPMHPQL